MEFRLPKSSFLKGLIVWMLIAVGLKILLLLQSENQTAGQAVGRFLASLVFRFFFGAFWSGFMLVSIAAMIAGATFIFAVMSRGPQSKDVAKFAIASLFFLSLFSIWIEPWLSPLGFLANVMLILLGLFSVLIEIGVTIGWLAVWAATHDALQSEF
jgi:hypothetical protein